MLTEYKTINIKFGCCEKPFSFFFDFISELWKEGGPDNPLHRICSLMRKMKVKTFCVEKLTKNKDLQKEFDALCRRCDRKINGTIFRISFFNKKLNGVSEIQEGYDPSFLGYAIIINADLPDGMSKSYILDSVVRVPTVFDENYGCPPFNTMNQYIHTAKYFLTSVGDKELSVFGSFYCQQNTLTAICAHATLRMVLNNHKSKSLRISNEKINEILGIDHKSKKFGQGNYSGDEGFSGDIFTKGLDQSQIEKVLKYYDLQSISQNYFEQPNMNYSDFVYCAIESGYPAIVAFTTSSLNLHVVPIIGHTLNTDIWNPEAESYYREFKEYHTSSSWVDHFIFHDDNLGMYYNLPIKALHRITIPREDPRFRVYYAIGIFPKIVKTSPSIIQRYASALLYNVLDYETFGNKWNAELLNQVTRYKRFPVIRTLLIDRESYIEKLKIMKDSQMNQYSDNHIEYIKSRLRRKRWFWMNEISLPDLYTANKTKIGEVLLKCDKNSDNLEELFLLLRLPNVTLDLNNTTTPTDIQSHQDLFRFSRKDENKNFEW